MKVFVTGGTGYVGSRVVAELLEQGHKVVSLCRTEEQAEKLRKLGVEPLIGDVREVGPLENAAREADAVLHLAFIHNFATFDENVAVDKNVINAYHRALKGTGKRVIFTSGTGSLGATEPGETVSDMVDITQPPYKMTMSRAELERYALRLAQDGLNISCIRLPPFVYGENGSGFIPFGIINAHKLGASYYINDGSQKHSFCHVRDCAHAYVLALTKAKAGAGYNCVSENMVSNKEFAEAVGKLVGVEAKSITVPEGQKLFGPILTMIFSMNHSAASVRIVQDLGWKPVFPTTVLDDITHGSYTADAHVKSDKKLF